MKTLILLLAMAVAGPSFAQMSPVSPAGVSWDTESLMQSAPSQAPLPAEQAFVTKVEVSPDGQAQVSFTSQPGYYVYRQSISLGGEGMVLGELDLPEGRLVDDVNFGLTRVYDDTVTVQTPVSSRSGDQAQISVNFQGCKEDSVCYSPMTRTLTVDLPESIPLVQGESGNTVSSTSAAPELEQAEDQRLASILGDQPAAVALALFFGFGVLLGLTPCVLPMVPIVLGLVSGSQVRTKRTAVLAGTYVFSHALVFALLGMVASWVGGGVSAIFQNAWAVIPLALVLGGLGAAMLLGIQIQMPNAIQSWASLRGQGGSVPGAAGMGAVSSLIIGPCVAPPLAGIILYLAHEGNPWLGAGALFALGLGMGAPMMAAALGFKRFLPQGGELGRWIMVAMGVMFVGMAAWLASRVVPTEAVAMVAAAVMAVIALRSWKNRAPATEGSGRKGHEWLAYAMVGSLSLAWALTPKPEAPPSAFETVVAAEELQQHLDLAHKNGETVVVDVYADWCTACQDMERETLSSPMVHDRLDLPGTRALKVDVTHNTQGDQQLLKEYGLVGPPAFLFFDGKEEQRHLRLIGVEDAEPFVHRIHTSQCQAHDHEHDHDHQSDHAHAHLQADTEEKDLMC